MKAVLYIVAILLIAAGVAVGLMSFFSPGQVLHGIDAGLAATLVAGGFIVLGLAGVIEAIEAMTATVARAARSREAAPASVSAPEAQISPALAAPAVAAAAEGIGETSVPKEETAEVAPVEVEEAVPAAAGAEQPEKETVAEAPEAEAAATVAEPAAAPEEPERVPEEVAEQPAEAAEAPVLEVFGEELYVVEERMFRGKPARILSDGTVEAETEEGWMRFENLEHLEEYMDAMATGRV